MHDSTPISDEPRTGELPQSAVAFVGCAQGLFVMPIQAVDFYADEAKPL